MRTLYVVDIFNKPCSSLPSAASDLNLMEKDDGYEAADDVDGEWVEDGSCLLRRAVCFIYQGCISRRCYQHVCYRLCSSCVSTTQ